METLVDQSATAGIPLLLAALAVIVASRAGVLNIAVEGLMLGGAFVVAAIGAPAGGDVGFVAAIGVGLVAGLALAWIMIVLRADQVVAGIAFNILVLGITSYGFGIIAGGNPEGLTVGEPSTYRIPGLADIPGFGVLFDRHWIAYLAYALVPLTWYALFKTGLGTRLRACGEYAEGARAVGINVVRMRFLAMGLSSVLATAAGTYLVLGDVGLFRRNLSGGRGYIGFVIVILARYHPAGAFVAAAGFGLAQALTFYLQLQGIEIPSQFIIATPYVVTLLAIVLLGRRIGQPPAEEGRPLYTSR